LNYIANNWICTDRTHLLTGSAGASYLFTGTQNLWPDGTKMSATTIYGSGLRATAGAGCIHLDRRLCGRQFRQRLQQRGRDNPARHRFDRSFRPAWRRSAELLCRPIGAQGRNVHSGLRRPQLVHPLSGRLGDVIGSLLVYAKGRRGVDECRL
jgi:hypothetical protein